MDEDACIRVELWSSMKQHISSTLVFLEIVEHVWSQALEMYSSVNNLCSTYDLHQKFFSVTW